MNPKLRRAASRHPATIPAFDAADFAPTARRLD
jgi:hypothetical protein